MKYKSEVTIYVISLLLKLALLACIMAFNTDQLVFYDSASFLQIAHNIVQGKGFTASEYVVGMPGSPPQLFNTQFQNGVLQVFDVSLVGRPETFRTPVYPYFIALGLFLFGSNLLWISVLQAILTSAIPVIIYKLVTLSRGHSRVAIPLSLLAAVDPASLGYSVKFLSESVFTLLLWASVYLLTLSRLRSSAFLVALAGLMLSLSILTRPIALLLPFLFLLVFILGPTTEATKTRVSLLALFAVFALAPVVAWMVRNYSVSGVFTLSTVSAGNATFWAKECCVSSDVFDAQYFARVSEAENQCRCQLNIEKKSQILQTLSLEVLARSPIDFLMSRLNNVPKLLLTTGHNELFLVFARSNPGPVLGRSDVSASQVISLIIGLLILGLQYFVFLCGMLNLCFKDHSVKRVGALISLVAVGYLISMSLGSETSYRFRVPILPGLLIIGGLSADSFGQMVSRSLSSVLAKRSCCNKSRHLS